MCGISKGGGLVSPDIDLPPSRVDIGSSVPTRPSFNVTPVNGID
jgi:hypothetical protein